jgi:hypothetical protein
VLGVGPWSACGCKLIYTILHSSLWFVFPVEITSLNEGDEICTMIYMKVGCTIIYYNRGVFQCLRVYRISRNWMNHRKRSQGSKAYLNGTDEAAAIYIVNGQW